MQEKYQKTLSKIIQLEGIGLHSGVKSKIKILPAESNTGIIFKRVDVKKNNTIEANYKNVFSAKLCTSLKNKSDISISTVEHLMAAFYMTGVDNALVEVNGPEIPIMDGSAKDFVESINNVGLEILTEKRKYLKILRNVENKVGEKYISIKPASFGLEVNFQLDYKNKIIGKQQNKVNFLKDDLEDIFSSRTFCLFEDIAKIQKNGLAKGGSLENAIVVEDTKILNKDGLRNDKEFVNHKILDLVGDFFLSGFRIIGNIESIQGGHQLSTSFLKQMFEQKNNYTLLELENTDYKKKGFVVQNQKIAVSA